MPYNGWTNRATWNASMEFDSDSYFQELIGDTIEEVLEDVSMGRRVSLEYLRDAIESALAGRIEELSETAESCHEDNIFSAVESMSPQEAYEYGKAQGDEDINYQEIVETAFMNHRLWFASCKFRGENYTVAAMSEDDAVDRLCEALNDEDSELDFAKSDKNMVSDEESGETLTVRTDSWDVSFDSDDAEQPNPQPGM